MYRYSSRMWGLFAELVLVTVILSVSAPLGHASQVHFLPFKKTAGRVNLVTHVKIISVKRTKTRMRLKDGSQGPVTQMHVAYQATILDTVWGDRSEIDKDVTLRHNVHVAIKYDENGKGMAYSPQREGSGREHSMKEGQEYLVCSWQDKIVKLELGVLYVAPIDRRAEILAEIITAQGWSVRDKIVWRATMTRPMYIQGQTIGVRFEFRNTRTTPVSILGCDKFHSWQYRLRDHANGREWTVKSSIHEMEAVMKIQPAPPRVLKPGGIHVINVDLSRKWFTYHHGARSENHVVPGEYDVTIQMQLDGAGDSFFTGPVSSTASMSVYGTLYEQTPLKRGPNKAWGMRLVRPFSERQKNESLEAWDIKHQVKDFQISADDDVCLILTGPAVTSNDLLWVQGGVARHQRDRIFIQFTHASWQGPLHRTGPGTHSLGIRVGSLPAGKYDVYWEVVPYGYNKVLGTRSRPVKLISTDKEWIRGRFPITIAASKRTDLTFKKAMTPSNKPDAGDGK